MPLQTHVPGGLYCSVRTDKYVAVGRKSPGRRICLANTREQLFMRYSRFSIRQAVIQAALLYALPASDDFQPLPGRLGTSWP